MIMDIDNGPTRPPLPNAHNQPLPLPAPTPAIAPSSYHPQDTPAAQPLHHPLQGPPRQPGVGISPGLHARAADLVAPNGPNEAAPAPAVSHREAAGAPPGAE